MNSTAYGAVKLSTGFRIFGKAAKAWAESDTEEFWRHINHWWYGEYVDKPRLEAMGQLELLLNEFDNITTCKYGVNVSANTILSNDSFGSVFNAKGYWEIGGFSIYTDKEPTRIGAYLVRKMLGVKWVKKS